MRPIDSDALKEQLEDWLKLIQGFMSDECEITRDVLLSVIHGYIADMPTIDAAPVRRGEWVAVGDDDQDVGIFFCSLCKDERWFGEEVYTSAEAARLCPYCPNCGADMRKEEHAHDD